MHKMVSNVPYTIWCEVWRKKLVKMDVNGMLEQCSGTMGMGVMRSAIKHPMLGKGEFSKVKLGKGTVVGYYSRMIFYENLYGRQGDDRRFREGGLSGSVEDFQTYPVHILKGVKEFDGNLHNAWNVLADFNSLWYINSPHNLKRDRTPPLVREANSRTSNMRFVQNFIPANFPDSKRGGIMVLKPLRNGEQGEKLFSSYGSSYIFVVAHCVPRAEKLGLLL